jgi:hypothetical protein
MEDRGVPSPSQGRRPKCDRGQRKERDEHARMREFIHELYEELLSLSVAARSILHWPLGTADLGRRPKMKLVNSVAKQITPEKPVNALDPNRRNGSTTEEEAREKGFDQTLEDSFPSSDPPSTIPDPMEPTAAARRRN